MEVKNNKMLFNSKNCFKFVPLVFDREDLSQNVARKNRERSHIIRYAQRRSCERHKRDQDSN